MKFARRCKPGDKIPISGKKVAIIGAGPAGLGAAGELICYGHEVHVYDMLPEPGGLLIFGIPEFRIPKEGVRKGIKELIELGVVFHLNTKVGEDVEFEKILNDFDAVLIATGTWKSRRLNIPGEDLEGVYHALEFIVDYHLHKYGYSEHAIKLKDRVLVIGGGLTAVDACYLARDAGAEEVYLIYRRTREFSPAGVREFNKLEENGFKIYELTQPIEFIGDDEGKLRYVKAIRMKLGEKDSSGRPRPVPIENSDFTIEVSAVLVAAGEIATPPFANEKYGIETTKWNTIKTDKEYKTTRKGVFAAGDVVSGPSLIGPALASGKKAALSVHKYLETGEWKWIE